MERERFLERTEYQARTLKRLLRELDPNLDLVWVKEKAMLMPGLVPGRWHVQRKNPGAPDSYFPITKEDGGYMEPHAGVVEQLRQDDLSRVGDVGQFLRDRRDREQKVSEKKKALSKEQRKDHMAEDYRAAKRVAGESIHRKRWGAGKAA